MKQILRNLDNGETALADLPVPSARSQALLIRSTVSLVSTGTERILADCGKANLLDKAQQQPDKVKMVLEKSFLFRCRVSMGLLLEHPVVGFIGAPGNEVENKNAAKRLETVADRLGVELNG